MNPFTNDINEYEEEALRTAKDMGSVKMNLIHAALGLSSDVGEFVDCIKKHAIYGKDLDKKNAIEELGDVLWFVVLACNTLDVNLSDVMRANIEKLAKRYPDKYSDEAAIARADKVTLAGIDIIKDETLKPNDVVIKLDTRYHHQKLMDACPSATVTFTSSNYIDAQNYRYFVTSLEVKYEELVYPANAYTTSVRKGTEAWNNWYISATEVPA